MVGDKLNTEDCMNHPVVLQVKAKEELRFRIRCCKKSQLQGLKQSNSIFCQHATKKCLNKAAFDHERKTCQKMNWFNTPSAP